MTRCLAAVTAVILGALPPLAGAATLLSLNPGSVVEGDVGEVRLSFLITRSGDLTHPVNVGLFTLQTGLAQAGVDYEELAFGNRVVVPAGAGSATFHITVLGDRTPEFNEAFTVALASPYEEDGAARTLAPVLEVAAPANPGHHIVADIDDDGRPDLVVSRGAETGLAVLRNTSVGDTITFAAPASVATTSPVGRVVAADFDGDGRVDLAATYPSTDEVAFLRNRSVPGTVAFGAALELAAGDQPSALAVGDYDGDGRPDVAVGHDALTPSLFRNGSTAGQVAFATDGSAPDGGGANDIEFVDLDGDSLPELVTVHASGSEVLVRRNVCCATAPFGTAQAVAVAGPATAIAAGDVDGDGLADIVVNTPTVAAVSVLRNTSTPGAVSFAPAQEVAAGEAPADVAIGDVDGDGLPEILASEPPASAVIVLFNDSTAGTPAFLAPVPHDTGTNPSAFGLAATDINGDAFADVVTLNPSAPSAGILRSKGTDVALDASQFEAYIFNDDAFPASGALSPLALLGLPALLLLRRRRS